VFRTGQKRGSNKGVAFIIDAPVIEYALISGQIKCFNLMIISEYASTEENKDIIKDQFYHKPGQVHDSIPANDIRMIMGNFSVLIRKKDVHFGKI
jgi:hypothetical protein